MVDLSEGFRYRRRHGAEGFSQHRALGVAFCIDLTYDFEPRFYLDWRTISIAL